ncbi:MAG: MFS transporter, partial [Pararhodobacter sp.]|nr:MFS transporter [Pararhodobacter sp.]
MIGAGAAVALQIGKVPAALPFLQAELGLTLIQSGWVVAIFSAVAAGFAIFLGAASDRVGPLAAALAGMLLSAISGIAGGFVSGGTLLLLSRVFEGLGFIFTTTSIPSLIVMVVSAKDRKASLAIWGMYMPLGSGVMLALSGPLLYFFEWRVLWWATSALILAAMIPMFMFGKRIATDTSARALRPKFCKSIRASLRRGPIMLSAIFAIYAALYLTVVGFLPSILIGVDRFTPISAATVGAVASLFNVLGNGLSGWLHNRRFQFLPLVLTGCAGMAVFGS